MAIYNIVPQTFTGSLERAVAALQRGSNGALEEVAAGLPRDNHYVGAARVILVEGAHINSVVSPNDITGYTRSRMTGPAATDSRLLPIPGGGLAYRQVEDDTTGTHLVRVPDAQAITPAVGQWVAASVMVDPDGRDELQFDLMNGVWAGGGSASVQVNLSGAGAAVGGNALMRGVEQLDDGWFRVWVIDQATAITPFAPRVIFRSGGTGSYEGDGVSGMYLGGWNVALGYSSLSSYAEVERASDRWYVPYTTPPQTVTYYMRFIESGDVRQTTTKIFHLGHSGNDGPRIIINSGGGFWRAGIHDGGEGSTAYSTLAAATLPQRGDVVELRLVHDYSTGRVQLHQSLNGGVEESAPVSSARPFSGGWGDQRVYFGATSLTASYALQLLSAKAEVGVRTMQAMRDILEFPFQILRPVQTTVSGWSGSSTYSNIAEETPNHSNFIQSGDTGEEAVTFRLSELAGEVVTAGGASKVRYYAGKVDDAGNYTADGEPVTLRVEFLPPTGSGFTPPQVFEHPLGLLTLYEDAISDGITLSGQCRVRFTTLRS